LDALLAQSPLDLVEATLDAANGIVNRRWLCAAERRKGCSIHGGRRVGDRRFLSDCRRGGKKKCRNQ
jgi:hypothetical protein